MAITARFWRFQFTWINLDEAIVSEIRMNDVPGGTNQTGSGIASGSGYYASFFPANAFDGAVNPDAPWVMYWGFGALSRDTWLAYDFGAPKSVGELVVTNGRDFFPSYLTVSTSDDGEQWTPALVNVPMVQGNQASTTIAVTTADIAPFEIVSHQFAATSGFVPTTSLAQLVGEGASLDQAYGGGGTIAGEVDVTGTPNIPVSREVRLHGALTGKLVASTWSDPVTGRYRFGGLNPAQAFYVIAFDFERNYNAVVKDNIRPVVLA